MVTPRNRKTNRINRETVGKYINQYEDRRKQLLAAGKHDVQALIDALTTAPKYTVGQRPKRKLTKEIEEQIKQHLSENEEKRNKGIHKQQKKTIDIFEALEAEGVDISYSCPEIPHHIHCYLIRKTRAMTLYRQGMPLTVIMNMLGHENLSTTSNFYAFATTEMIHEAMKKTSPEEVTEAPIWKTEDVKKLLYSLD